MKFFEMISTVKVYAGQHDVVPPFGFGDFGFLTPFGAGGDEANTLTIVFGRVIGLVLLVAAIVAFFYLIVSGFQYMTAGGDADKATKARQGIINAIIGIVIILISYVVITYVAGVVGGGDTVTGGGVVGP